MFKEKMTKEKYAKLHKKSKTGFLKLLFGRTGILAVFFIIQIIFIYQIFAWFSTTLPIFYGGNLLVLSIIVIHLVHKDEDVTIKMTWMAIIMFAPIFGIGFYLYTQIQLKTRSLRDKAYKAIEVSNKFSLKNTELNDYLKENEKELYAISNYLNKDNDFPVFQNTEVKYYKVGEEKLEDLLIELEKAEKFIFLEYFLLEDAFIWSQVSEVLERKVKEGVEVRLMYDGTCHISLLSHDFPEKVAKLGIKCKLFSKITPVLSTHHNFRDHRKIVVIDNKIGFTGGINITDAHFNAEIPAPFGHWKDTAVKLTGEGVSSLTKMFLQMWNLDDNVDEYAKFLQNKHSKASKGYVIPYGDNPFDREPVGKMVYIDMINRAQNYLYIMTPYLVIDTETESALAFAAKRGVDVRIITPHIPDKEYVFALTRNYYKKLLSDGVKIFEYKDGFVHAKTMISDDIKAIVGTINLDYRSFYIDFECAAYMYKSDVVFDIKKDFEETFEKTIEITEEFLKKDKLSRKIMGIYMRIFAPLL